jgi:ribose transport system substrate-binding protein
LGRVSLLTFGALALCASLVLAACGSSSGGSSSGEPAATVNSAGKVGSIPGYTKKQSEEAVKAGEEAAKLSGKKVTLPKMTVGFLNDVTTVESGQAIAEEAPKVGKLLGWKVISLSTEGEPSKMGPDAQQLLNRGAEAIISVANEPAAMTAALKEAEAEGIPFINNQSEVPASTGVTSQLVENKVHSEEIMVEQLMSKHLKKGSTIGALYTPLLPAEVESFKYLEEKAPSYGWEIVESQPVDLANVGPGGEQATNSILTAHPEVSALWGDVAAYADIQSQEVKQRGDCGKIQVWGHGVTQQNLELIREGCITGVTDYPQNAGVWLAFDQLAHWKAHDIPLSQFPKNQQQVYEEQYGGYEPDLATAVDDSNVVEAGKSQPPPNDYQSFFLTKWKDEYGLEAQPIDLSYGTPGSGASK